MSAGDATGGMRLLHLVCKSCGARFPSGVPLRREHVEGVKLRALEICPACGAGADYRGEDYLEPDSVAPANLAPAPGGAAPSLERNPAA